MPINVQNIPLTLYVHLPWCIRKCPYCDFNSHQATVSTLPEQEYIQALVADLQQDIPKMSGRQISSIFIGGGTPSLFSAKSIDTLLTAINHHLLFSAEIEITLEANPGSVEQQRFKDYYKAGINRISLGIQSFSNEKLTKLGRIHNGMEAESAITAVKNAGFSNFNLDLMFGLPEQTSSEALHDLNLAVKHQPTHLSWYKLTLEPNTYFHHHPPPLPDDDLIWEMFDEGQQFLHSNGYQQYEISAYSRQGFECWHNRNYWQFGDYIGIGAGAHSKLTLDNQEIVRFWKVKHPKLYLQAKSFIQEENKIEATQLPFEFMLNHLRLREKVPLQLFEERTGLSIETIEKVLNDAQKDGFIIWQNAYLELTEQGKRFTNDVLQLFL